MDPVASIYLEGTELIVSFFTDGVERDISLDVKSEQHSEVAKKVMEDPNFWINFVNSFSTAINNHVEGS